MKSPPRSADADDVKASNASSVNTVGLRTLLAPLRPARKYTPGDIRLVFFDL